MSQFGRRQSRRQQLKVTPPSFEITKHPEYKSWYVTGAFGGIAPNDARIILYQDRMEPEIVQGGTPGQLKISKINRELQMEIHLTPLEFKNLSQWMLRHVQRFEENFHEIITRPQEGGQDENPLVQ
jgi:hypothetical protein